MCDQRGKINTGTKSPKMSNIDRHSKELKKDDSHVLKVPYYGKLTLPMMSNNNNLCLQPVTISPEIRTVRLLLLFLAPKNKTVLELSPL